MVAAHVDMSKAKNPWMSGMWLECDSPGVKFEGQEMKREHKTGLFYLENVPPGICWISYAWSAPGHHFRFPRNRNNITALRVGKGEFRYMGSLQYRDAKDDHHFTFDRVPQPSEKEVLRRLAPLVNGTPWADLLQKRSTQLR